MKRIYVLRHGKSDWDADYDTDHDRPLKKRGIRAARRMGRFLAAAEEEPEAVVSSSAARALTTAQLAAEAGNWAAEIRVQPDLYGGGRARFLKEIQRQDDAIDSVLVAGHAPTCSDFIGSLIGSAEIRFPTAAVARIDVDVERWEAVQVGEGQLIWLVVPKLLERAGFDQL